MFSSGLSVKIDRLLFAHLPGKASSPKPSDNQPQIILHFATSHNNQIKTKRKPNQNQTKPKQKQTKPSLPRARAPAYLVWTRARAHSLQQ